MGRSLFDSLMADSNSLIAQLYHCMMSDLVVSISIYPSASAIMVFSWHEWFVSSSMLYCSQCSLEYFFTSGVVILLL